MIHYMPFEPKKHFNFNTFVIMLATALVGITLAKADAIYTATIAQGIHQKDIDGRLDKIDRRLEVFVSKLELTAEIASRDHDDLIELKKEFARLRQRPSAGGPNKTP